MQQQPPPQEAEAFGQFPAPPGFYRLYEGGPSAGPRPPAPVSGQIHALGEIFDTDAPFTPPLDVPQLYAVRPDGTIDVKAELTKLSRGLLFTFLELLGVLVEQPSGYAAPLSQVMVSLHNMLHLLNLAREHQARQTVTCTLQAQVQQKQAALAALRREADSMRASVLALTQQLAAAGGDAAESRPADLPAGVGGPQQQQKPAAAGAAAAAAMEEG